MCSILKHISAKLREKADFDQISKKKKHKKDVCFYEALSTRPAQYKKHLVPIMVV